MEQPDGRTRARLAVHAEMAHRRWNNTQLARAAGTDIATVSDFLSGARWPKSPTRGKIESALSWPPGTISAIEAGMPPPTVGGASEDEPEEDDDTLLYRRPEGLTDEEWEQVKRESRGFIEWQIQRAAQER
ncbi:hypothetical protein GCM10027273_45080 [Nocardioides pakistanensis]